ncbi:DUF4189 domain-containing protein [Leeia oryzae]|uniref:DUF4189 domain-containing protein n=1 Tax=Leeia oryzae TaxID=356662 RepID=UPI0014613899|nr:DUF4189 domain-containing protein [Leeia oryzae]
MFVASFGQKLLAPTSNKSDLMMKFPFISLLLYLINLSCFADSLCDDGYFNAELGICQSGGGANYYPGQDTLKQHQPRDYYGAIAADLLNGNGGGHSDNYQTLQNAEAGALESCNRSGCKIIISYKNTCGATSVPLYKPGRPELVYGAIGATPDAANRNAIAACQTENPEVQCVIWSKGKCSYRE